MMCPGCDEEMTRETGEEVTVDRCEGCGGVWFDPEEVFPYCSALEPAPRFVPCDADFLHHTKGLGGRCPCCAGESLEYGSVRGVSFQRCTWCGGIFLGGDELRQLLSSRVGQRTVWPRAAGPDNLAADREWSITDVAVCLLLP